jgi:hypothetical protein
MPHGAGSWPAPRGIVRGRTSSSPTHPDSGREVEIMTACTTAFVGALVLGSLLAGCAQSPRGSVTSTIPPADKPLAVDPALLGPKAAATGHQPGSGGVVKGPERLSEGR